MTPMRGANVNGNGSVMHKQQTISIHEKYLKYWNN